MRRVYNLIVLCMLLICQQHIIAQSYNLGKQKQSFVYNTLYTNHAQKAINNNETINTQPIAITNDFQTKCAQIHKQIIKLSEHYYGGQVFKKYNNIYKTISQTQENIDNLQKIQYVVISYLNSKGSAYPTLETELKNAASVEAEIQIFLSYYKE